MILRTPVTHGMMSGAPRTERASRSSWICTTPVCPSPPRSTAPGVVVEHVPGSRIKAAGQRPVGDIGCQRSLGWSAAKRTKELRGRLCGSGVTKPRRESTRQIVDTAGALPYRRSRWTAIVTAPASSARFLRSSTMAFSISTERVGQVRGRRRRTRSVVSARE